MKWAGGIIDQPGIYEGLPIDRYHGQPCAGPSVSSSGLRTIDAESPLHFWARSSLNPNRLPEEEKDHLALGKAAHHLFTGEGDFWRHYVIRPDKWADWRTGESRAWREAQRAAGLTVLVDKQMDQIKGMAASLAAHPTIRAGLLNGEAERSIIWQDEKTGVWLKSRPDILPVDSDMVVDLKTCSSADPLSVRRSIADYGYHMQLALAFEGMKAVTGREMRDHVLVFIETAPPYAVNIKPIDPVDIEDGRRQVRRAIDTFARCVETGEWPGYADDEVPASLPSYYRNRLAAEAEAKLLPALDAA
jgi:hypothetical protein